MAFLDTTRAALLFVALGLAVLLAVYGWIRVGEARHDAEAGRAGTAGWLVFALLHTSAAAAAWWALASPAFAG